ncbi:hypothetical protein G6011_00108 [Alternaria panax]|uniref:SCP domain-containing protein n=1 Tax=Alternaria panax TaxID=48097 RepID=A0AAD4IHL5_9PLEO|nr:hypothetical protein G6011_00108 [Alternaria panax]
MRYFILFAASLVASVLARPQLHGRQPKMIIETKIVIQTIVITLTKGYVPPTPTPSAFSSITRAATPTPEPSLSWTPKVPDAPAMSQAPIPSITPVPTSIAPIQDHPSGQDQAYLSSGPDYQAAVLFHHNAARANHNAGPLTWDSECEANARIAASRCSFEHYIPKGAGQGQNLFVVSGDAFNATAGISESWYWGELNLMMPWFGKSNLPHEVFEQVGHLTQMVWKETTKVGCVSLDCGMAMTVNGQGSTMNKYTVCNYSPAGNFGGQYAANVEPPVPSAKLVGWAD